METTRGYVTKKDSNWIFRWVYLIEDGDSVHMKEIPLSPEYVHTINDGERVEAYVFDSEDGPKIAKLLPRGPEDMPYPTNFPELWVRNVSDGSVHEVNKYIKNPEGEIHIWCHTWYGHHILGRDCIFTKERAKQ